MAKIRVLARDDLLVTEPGSLILKGQIARYVGRKFQPARGGQFVAYPATEKPSVYDLDSKEGLRIKKMVRRGALWPADKESAELCGVPFVKPISKDGVHATPDSALPESVKKAKAKQAAAKQAEKKAADKGSDSTGPGKGQE